MNTRILNPFAYLVEDFLSAEECQALIDHSEAKGYHAAKVNLHGRQVMMTSVRNNDRVLEMDEVRAAALWERLCTVHTEKTEDAIPIGLNELFRYYKYADGQRFKRHRDGSFERNGREYSMYTLLVYLNEAFEGGETIFQDVTIQPKTGTALVFRHELLHEGAPVVQGTKYVLRTDIMYKFIGSET